MKLNCEKRINARISDTILTPHSTTSSFITLTSPNNDLKAILLIVLRIRRRVVKWVFVNDQ